MMVKVNEDDTPSTRQRILQIALSLMSQKGVDGTSMRDLASATGLNVASLYHYFPSKRDLLEAVLSERGYLPVGAGWHMPKDEPAPEDPLAALLSDILGSMFEIDDFVRLMVGEAMRGEETARAMGLDLFTTFHASIEEWVKEHRPDLAERTGAPAVARLLSTMVVGIFVSHAAGVIPTEEGGLAAIVAQRAQEAAQILSQIP
ncbi:MAG TPA: TetR/AcrR family transcriptional regulator [Acidimicrobiales bacterium]|nr:TetR/AcrR family transcriptional regulator [Acidimicrobiales bacterium]